MSPGDLLRRRYGATSGLQAQEISCSHIARVSVAPTSSVYIQARRCDKDRFQWRDSVKAATKADIYENGGLLTS
jgi:hypothetical protein